MKNGQSFNSVTWRKFIYRYLFNLNMCSAIRMTIEQNVAKVDPGSGKLPKSQLYQLYLETLIVHDCRQWRETGRAECPGPVFCPGRKFNFCPRPGSVPLKISNYFPCSVPFPFTGQNISAFNQIFSSLSDWRVGHRPFCACRIDVHLRRSGGKWNKFWTN